MGDYCGQPAVSGEDGRSNLTSRTCGTAICLQGHLSCPVRIESSFVLQSLLVLHLLVNLRSYRIFKSARSCHCLESERQLATPCMQCLDCFANQELLDQ
jgi:hypothetical protein